MEHSDSKLPKSNVKLDMLVVPALASLVLALILALVLGEGNVGSLWFVTAVAAAIPGLLLFTGTLPFIPNIVFYAIYFEAFIYLFVAPSLYASSELVGNPDLVDLYLFIEMGVLVLFLPVLIIGYRLVAPRLFPLTGIVHRPTLKINSIRWLWLTIVSISLSVAYLLILAGADLLFRRIGHQALADAYLGLPRWEYFTVRIYDRLALPMICLLLILLWQPQPRRYRILTLVALLVSGSSYFLVTILNSRLEVLQVVFIALVVALFWGRRYITWSPKLAFRLGSVGLIAVYLLTVTLAVRQLLPTGELNLAALNPFRETAGQSSANDAFRLNCVDLMAQMTPQAQRAGYSMGASWQPLVTITFGQLLDSDTVSQYKQALATTPKYYLMLDYLGVSVADYPSCMATDAYGNLGLVGLVVAGVVLGVLVALAMKWSITPSASWQLVFGLVLLQMTTRFEGDFISLVLDWVPYAPVVVLLLIVNPLKVDRHLLEKTVV